MQKAVHREILERALHAEFSSRALEVIARANLGQDAPCYQIGHDHFHYDANAFDESDEYVRAQHARLRSALAADQPGPAWRAFGRLTHAVQDFYAHSNYIPMWLARFGASPPGPEAVEILDADLLSSPGKRSGKLYYPLEVLSFIDPLARHVIPWLPRDSHAWMNIDGPERPYFAYAFAAAVKRTRHEFHCAVRGMKPEAVRLFKDR